MPLITILLSILCSASAQIALKIGVQDLPIRTEFSIGHLPQLFIKLFTNGWLIGGVILYVLSLLIWLVVLKQVAVSTAYPFTALGFVFVVLIGTLFLGEPMSLLKGAGVGCIVAGVVLLSKSLT